MARGTDRFGAQLFATYSDSKSPSRTGVECTPACCLPDSFVVFDAVAWWKINDALTARAGVFTVADEKYWGWGDVRGVSSTTTFIDAFGQPGRSASVSLAMQFQPLHADRGGNDPDQHSGMFTAKPPREVSL